MLTLGQVKSSSISNVAGVNVNDPQFTMQVNDAVRQLMDMGDWWATVVSMKGVVAGGCMTWPHKIDAVLAINLNGRAERLANHWYSFIPINGHFSEMIESRDFYTTWGRGHHQRNAVEFSGTQAMFSPPSLENPFQIQVAATNPADYGKSVTIYGFDANGQEVFSDQFDSTAQAVVSQRGIKMTLAAAAPYTAVMTNVSAVIKDVTVGDLWAWKYISGATPSVDGVVAIWRGSQTSPEFLYSRISNADKNRIYTMDALVKIGYEAVAQDSDILPLGNIDAIKSMVQCIRSREQGDEQVADKHEATALRRLNMELRNRFPDEQFVAENATFSGVNMSRKTRIY